MRTFLTLAVLALALPAAAAAGGWATAGLAPPPAGLGPGETWRAEITLLQHGVTPLQGVSPTLTILRPGDARTFEAKPTGKPGVYVAEVAFPAAGTWSYRLDDGFSQVHTFAPVEIGAPGVTTPGGSGFPAWGAVPIAAGVLALVAGAVLVRRRLAHGLPALD